MIEQKTNVGAEKEPTAKPAEGLAPTVAKLVTAGIVVTGLMLLMSEKVDPRNYGVR